MAVFAGLWGGGVAMDLMTLFMSVLALFADEVLPFSFDPTGAAVRCAALVAAVYVAWGTVCMQRRERGVCVRCGQDDRVGVDRSRTARSAAYVSILPAVAYATLKVHWALGGTVGWDDPAVTGAIGVWTPGFMDTVIMAAVGIFVALGMAHRMRLPRPLLLGPALVGLAMLLPVSVWGNVGNVVVMLGFAEYPSGLAPWVLWFVYPCFAVWGLCLLTVTVDYAAATSRPCRRCGRHRALRHGSAVSLVESDRISV